MAASRPIGGRAESAGLGHRHLVRDRRVGLNCDVDLRAFLQLDFVAVIVDQPIGNTNFAIQMVSTLDGDLRLFRLVALGMRFDDLLYFSWKRSSCFGFPRRHG